MPTGVTALRGWIPLVNLDECASIPPGFVLKLPSKLTPTHVINRFCKGVILDHVLDLQTLDAYHFVLADNASRELMLIIPTSISNLGVCFSYLEPCLSPILAALFLLGKPTLSLSQLLLIFAEVAWIAHMLPVRGDNHRLQAKIKSYLLVNNGKRLDILFYQDAHKVAISGVLGDGNGGRLCSFGQGTRPHDIQRSIHLGKVKRCTIPLESRGGVFCRLLPMPTMEFGILSTPFKEVLEGFLQVAQSLLGRH